MYLTKIYNWIIFFFTVMRKSPVVRMRMKAKMKRKRIIRLEVLNER